MSQFLYCIPTNKTTYFGSVSFEPDKKPILVWTIDAVSLLSVPSHGVSRPDSAGSDDEPPASLIRRMTRKTFWFSSNAGLNRVFEICLYYVKKSHCNGGLIN